MRVVSYEQISQRCCGVSILDKTGMTGQVPENLLQAGLFFEQGLDQIGCRGLFQPQLLHDVVAPVQCRWHVRYSKIKKRQAAPYGEKVKS